MPLAGKQLTFGWALALCYDVGWQRKDNLETAVALMCAESARYPDSWHDNLSEDGVVKVSTDWGLFQINDKAHPDIEVPWILNPIANAQYAYKLFKEHGKSFNPWAAYNNDAHLKFLPLVRDAYDLGRWKNKTDLVVKHFG